MKFSIFPAPLVVDMARDRNNRPRSLRDATTHHEQAAGFPRDAVCMLPFHSISTIKREAIEVVPFGDGCSISISFTAGARAQQNGELADDSGARERIREFRGLGKTLPRRTGRMRCLREIDSSGRRDRMGQKRYWARMKRGERLCQ